MTAFSSRPRSRFAALVRSSCPECGFTQLEWMSGRDLAWRVEPGDRLRLFDLLDFVGPDADAWYCRRCRNWGAFDAEHAL